MKTNNTVKQFGIKKLGTQAIALTGALISGAALADDSSNVSGAISGAVTTGQTNYTLVVVGLLSMAAIGFGLKMMTGAMRS
ncbi:hypothetical protein [Vibrio sagamiensis]|uniref:Uncharacterized protein n=1 Tax=Vibrio sagamiensis NBRC 104589 TaxID=1219064 RepID=A0A511QJS7_9VIBR|nr:hypothetical protein [Vibrio sagamiensis]PNQ58994.1 hypothetical protein C1141_12580 [Vibrio agarivorans]GEM77531.1 hypothetical protein VSA01S_36430 [Vibrio sagamiensis NBRC 104589]